eukprot:COSAG06_NODE_218_length_20036_cov_21.649446_13_plen_253_part_00
MHLDTTLCVPPCRARLPRCYCAHAARSKPYPHGRSLRTLTEQTKWAAKKLSPSLVQKVQFLLLTIMGMFNVVTMVDRFINRPERDETQEFNLSVIFLAWVEITYVAIWGGSLVLYVLYALCVGVKKSCVAPEKKDAEIGSDPTAEAAAHQEEQARKLREELGDMKLSALKKRAKEEGVDEVYSLFLEEADDADDTKSAVIELIVEKALDNISMADVDAAARLRTAAFLLNKLLTITVLKGLGGAYRRFVLPI